MIRLWLFVPFLAGILSEDIEVAEKWTTIFPNKLINVNSTWTLTATEGSTIKVFCPDVRFSHAETEEEACKYSKISFDDGVEKRTVCGTQYDFQVVGKSTKMTITLDLPDGSAGNVECLAKAVHPPKSYEEVTISLSEGVKVVKFPEVLGEENDKAWRFRSANDLKISLQCRVQSEREYGGVCVKDIITVDNGKGPKEQCGYDDVVAISSGTEITLRFETFPTTQSAIECLVQTITGSSPNEFENVGGPKVEDPLKQGDTRNLKGTTCDCGRVNLPYQDATVIPDDDDEGSGRIINGTEVSSESKYPFMVSLRTWGNWHFCGASIISPLHILTAAHCVSDSTTKSQPNPDELMAVVGAHSTREDASHGQTQKLRVFKVSIPKEWFTGSGLDGDIALLHLSTPIRFSKWVSPVCLTPKRPAIINKFVKHMGWGETGNGPATRLREADVQVWDNAICNRNPKEVCFMNGPSTSCFGDSGGPFVYLDPETNRYTQVALASYGYQKCHGNYFIGTNTARWFNWISETMLESTTQYQICRKKD